MRLDPPGRGSGPAEAVTSSASRTAAAATASPARDAPPAHAGHFHHQGAQ